MSAVNLVYKQTKETVDQEARGVTVRLATVTCPCDRKRSLMHMYKCLYCSVWFCKECAEEHFGKTVEQYRAEKREGVSPE